MVHEHVDRVFERDGLSLCRTLVQTIGSRFGEWTLRGGFQVNAWRRDR